MEKDARFCGGAVLGIDGCETSKHLIIREKRIISPKDVIRRIWDKEIAGNET